MPQSFRLTPIAADQLTATDLRDTLASYAFEGAEVYAVTLFDKDGKPTAQRAEALYLPREQRLGIAWGADATWATVADAEAGVEMWLNQPDKWNAAN